LSFLLKSLAEAGTILHNAQQPNLRVQYLVQALDLNNAIHVGHSTGGGEVARYIGRHDTKRMAKAALIGAIPPLMLKTPANRTAHR
jgi:pimeloyl-ACP methyl ester carboxylesterase